MNIQSIILLAVILIVAALVLYRHIKAPRKGCCGCDGCRECREKCEEQEGTKG